MNDPSYEQDIPGDMNATIKSVSKRVVCVHCKSAHGHIAYVAEYGRGKFICNACCRDSFFSVDKVTGQITYDTEQ